jgi:hypothetical protein
MALVTGLVINIEIYAVMAIAIEISRNDSLIVDFVDDP